MYLSALSDTKRLVNMFSILIIYESSFEKSHWTGVKPADLHVFSCQWLCSGQAAQSHILVEQTHTSFQGPSSIITFVYIPVLKVLSYTPISSTVEPSKIFKSCLVYPGPHCKNLTWEVLNTIFPWRNTKIILTPLPGIWKIIAPVDHLQIELGVPAWFFSWVNWRIAKRNMVFL